MPGNTFSMFEEKFGIIFASCPALRQMFAYRRRTGSFLRSNLRQPPDADFVAMRQRIQLRDIFWYGGRPLDNQPRAAPPGHPPPNCVSSGARSAAAAGEKSSLDVLADKMLHVFHASQAPQSQRPTGVGGWLRRARAFVRFGGGGGEKASSLERLQPSDPARGEGAQGSAEHDRSWPGSTHEPERRIADRYQAWGMGSDRGSGRAEGKKVTEPPATFLRTASTNLSAGGSGRSGSEVGDVGLPEMLRGPPVQRQDMLP